MATAYEPGVGKAASVFEPVRRARGRSRQRRTATAPDTEERLARLLSASPSVIYSFEAKGDFAPTFVSDNIRDIFGYEPREYLESPDFWRDCVHPDDLAAVEAEAARLFRDGRHTVEYRFRRKDGTYRWVNDEQRVIAGADGAPSEIVGSWSDITDRRTAEEAARAARDRIDHLLATSPAVIYSFKATGDFAPTFISRNLTDLLGYDREEYLASPDFWREHVHPADAQRVLGEFARLMQAGRLTYEYRFRKKDGAYCWISDELQLLRDAAGNPVEVVGAWSDVTARKQLGEVAVAAQDRLVHLLSSARAVIYSYKAFGDFAPTFVSQNIEDLLGYQPREYLESPNFWRGCVHPDDLAAVEAESVQLFRKSQHTVQYRFLKKDGSWCWVNDEQRLIRDQDGQPEEVVGSWTDITERQVGGRGGRCSAGPCRASGRQRASGHLQLQGYRRLRADFHQPERQGPARLRPGGISGKPGFLGEPRPPGRQPADPARL